MRLGLWYVPGDDEELERACAVAQGVLDKACVTAAEGYEALVRASAGESRPGDASAIVAWYEAEAAALLDVLHTTGVWSEQGALIVLND